MPKYDQKQVHEAMKDDIKFTRNVVVLGAMGSGKSTVCDLLGARMGFLAESQIGNRFTNLRADEKEKGSTLRANIVSMFETLYDEKQPYLFNVIDTPGHVEFSPETQGAIRMADAAIIVVDANEGMTVATDNFLTWCLREHVRPVLFVNKLDKCIIDLQKEAADLYSDIRQIVEAFEVTMTTVLGEKPFAPNLGVSPEKGNVLIGSALSGWAFTIPDFAKIYAKKFGIEQDKMAARLWGENYFNTATKKFTSASTGADGNSLPSSCEQFVMTPIIQLTNSILQGTEKWSKMCTSLGIELKPADLKLEGKALLNVVFRKWLNGGESMAKLMAMHCPDPKTAQNYRAEVIFSGPMDSDEAKSIKECNAKGPTMMHIIKMVPTGAAGRFYCVGRVFSGTVSAEKYRYQPPDYSPVKKIEEAAEPAEGEEAAEGEEGGAPAAPAPKVAVVSVQSGKLQSVHCILGKDFPVVPDVPAGQICAVSGADQFILKTATLTSKETFNFVPLKFVVSPIVRISIDPKNAKELPKLVEGLRRLCRSDMLVESKAEDTGGHQIGGCGDEHLKLLKADLLEHGKVEFITGVPTVSYKETIIGVTAAFGKEENPALSKSPNKHNRLYVIAKPLEEECVLAIEGGRISEEQELKARAKILVNEFGWDKADCLKIWGFGPMEVGATGPNMTVDQTKGVQYLNEIKESVNSGLLWAAREGPLCEESMRGIRFNIMDVKLHADSIHRGMGQIQPTARRVFYASMLTAMPRFQEPIFLANIIAPEDQVAGIRQALAGKRGELLTEDVSCGKVTVTGYLPVVETIGNDPFTKVLQTKTSGKAFADYAFNHWKHVESDPLEGPKFQGAKQISQPSKAFNLMMEVRKRKGCKIEAPPLEDYLDKL